MKREEWEIRSQRTVAKMMLAMMIHWQNLRPNIRDGVTSEAIPMPFLTSPLKGEEHSDISLPLRGREGWGWGRSRCVPRPSQKKGRGTRIKRKGE